ncbi:MAG: hypothetical protein WC777_05825 [Candidatus Gracilibacteria bacterium]|jgi:hypothetical protein
MATESAAQISPKWGIETSLARAREGGPVRVAALVRGEPYGQPVAIENLIRSSFDNVLLDLQFRQPGEHALAYSLGGDPDAFALGLIEVPARIQENGPLDFLGYVSTFWTSSRSFLPVLVSTEYSYDRQQSSQELVESCAQWHALYLNSTTDSLISDLRIFFECVKTGRPFLDNVHFPFRP